MSCLMSIVKTVLLSSCKYNASSHVKRKVEWDVCSAINNRTANQLTIRNTFVCLAVVYYVIPFIYKSIK